MEKRRVSLTFKIFLIISIMFSMCLGSLALYYKYLYKSNVKALLSKDIKAFTSSLGKTVDLYNMKDFSVATSLIRGTDITLSGDVYDKVDDEGNHDLYRKVKYENKEYYMNPEDISTTYEESVKQKEAYVRTSLTTYKDSESSNILGYSKKGSKLEVLGFDKINDDGSVNMYKVKINDTTEGYIYAKYTVDTKEEADKVYNENGTYDKHKDRKYRFELYGGSPKNLDYYPYEKPTFEDNPFVDQAKTYYLAGTKYILGDIDKYINLAKKAGANAFVVDIKDGALAYKSEVAKSYTMSSYNNAMNSVDTYKNAIKKIKDAGLYVIGRIVLFNDSTYAKDNSGECILSTSGNSTGWVSAYSRRAWEYNVKLAREAVSLFGFNEIQFDYVRFPESSWNYSKWGYNFRNTYNEEKAEAVQHFLYYAADEIHKDHVYLSVDVFGESSSDYVTAYGQYWPAISNIVDVISAMPYTDHFDRNNSAYWTNPYSTMLNWGKTAAARQKEIPTPAHVRTWITAYNTPYWNPTVTCDANYVINQVRGLVDAGLGHGFITWNGNSSYTIYERISAAFGKEY